ncbi:hypothetical protein IPF37_04110 [bacterium]|nr:MAG: hypothetical protein IPF37_04110 [bacterium]
MKKTCAAAPMQELASQLRSTQNARSITNSFDALASSVAIQALSHSHLHHHRAH